MSWQGEHNRMNTCSPAAASSTIEIMRGPRHAVLGPECRAVLLRKERTRQGRIVPTDATDSIADHVQRSIGWRESVIEEFALTRQQLGPSVEERARRNDDVRPPAFHRHGACGRRRNSPFLLNLRDLKRGLR